jgi:V/A-type H+-transporting ATPase subunit I
VAELSEFNMFHVNKATNSPSDAHLDNISLNSYKIFVELDEILNELNVSKEVGLIDTLIKGNEIKKEKFKAFDWTDFIKKLEIESNPIIKEFREILSERTNLQKQIGENKTMMEAFEMLSHFSINLDSIKSLKRFHIVFSLVSVKDLKEVILSLPNEIIVSTGLTRDKSALLIATSKGNTEKIEKILRNFDIKSLEIPKNLPQNPAEALHNINRNLKKDNDRSIELNITLNSKLSKLRQKILSLREGAKTAYEVLTNVKKVGNLEKFAVLNGFVPKPNISSFERKFGNNILILEEVDEKAHHESELKNSSPVPTFLKNSYIIKAFENITLNQGPPKHGEFDPTPLIMLTFPIFYGIMFGDLGHGIILSLFGFLLFIRGSGSIKQWGIMLTIAGISAATVGLIIGEVFGFAIGEIIPGFEHPILEIIEHEHGVKKFNTEAVSTLLQLSIIIGIFHLTIGFGLDVFKAIKENEYVEAFTEKIPTFIMYIFGIVFALAFIGAGNNFDGLLVKQDPIPLLGTPVAQAALISLPIILISVTVLIFGKSVAILLKKAPKDSIPMSIVMGVVEFLIRIVEFLANTMSYARLGILLLVHAALLMVLNKAVSLPIFIALPMVIIFNILIMMLEGLIVYIQDLRLHLYEWFTKFFEGTGILFQRMKHETTYFDIEWEPNENEIST